MSHSIMGRTSPVVCPLASLGRTSPSLDSQGYHLSSSPIDTQAYEMSREFLDREQDLDREDTPSPVGRHYHNYNRNRVSPFVEKTYQQLSDKCNPQQKRSNQNFHRQMTSTPPYLVSRNSNQSTASEKMYHLSRSSSSSLDQPYIQTNLNILNPQVYYFPRGSSNRSDESYTRKTPTHFDRLQQNRIHNKEMNSYVSSREAALANRERNYKLAANVLHHQVQYHRSNADTDSSADLRATSLDAVYLERYPNKNDNRYDTQTEQSYNYNSGYNLRNNVRNSGRISSPDGDTAQQLADSFNKALRASPSLDQGYHTLVSPSPGPSTPGPWTDINSTVLGPSKGKKLISKSNHFDKLSDDAISKIFAWLESSDLCVLARVCKRFDNLAWHPNLWRTITFKGENISGDKAVRCVLARLCTRGGAAACSGIERVFISDGCRLTERGLALLVRRCPELTHLQVQGCQTLTTQALGDLVTRCTNLQHLDLTGCTRVSWPSIEETIAPVGNCISAQRRSIQPSPGYSELSCRMPQQDICHQDNSRHLPKQDSASAYTDHSTRTQEALSSRSQGNHYTDISCRFLPQERRIPLQDSGFSEASQDAGYTDSLRGGLVYSECSRSNGVYVETSRDSLAQSGRYNSEAGYSEAARRFHPSAACPEASRRLPLQYLDMTDCTDLSDAGLKAAVKACPQLVYLYLRRCIHITDIGLKAVSAYCGGLRELSVSDCASITDFGLYELAKLGASLRYLSVAKCTQVSDAGLKAVARRCYKLRYLNARGCEAVSDDSITVLARSCPRLRALDLGKCDISDAGLRAIAESCPNLKKLSLRSCELVTDRGVQTIAYYCRGLQQLNIQDCQITLEGYRAVKKYCKRCVIEHTNPGFC